MSPFSATAVAELVVVIAIMIAAAIITNGNALLGALQ